MRLSLITAAVLSLTPLAAQAAEDTPEQLALEARHGFMLMLGANMGVLAGTAKGEIPYDEAAVVHAATNIEALTHYDVAMHFIPGTAEGEIDDSEALPKIWTDMAGFADKYKGLVTAAAGAPDAVKGGQEQVAAVVQKLGGACKACHDEYRKD
ncbi:cytochrome c [Paracoccus suum]|uniref:Cytochrome c n=1 Tax=Paracoccus suum TaxID=2259340 RepID=A0A344PIY3_9RHOB|nr:cytochrome c [Paracoccus suum]AXC49338.1 cytochrome c [Paracoccus suum]